jgi:hypothetical protein
VLGGHEHGQLVEDLILFGQKKSQSGQTKSFGQGSADSCQGTIGGRVDGQEADPVFQQGRNDPAGAVGGIEGS